MSEPQPAPDLTGRPAAHAPRARSPTPELDSEPEPGDDFSPPNEPDSALSPTVSPGEDPFRLANHVWAKHHQATISIEPLPNQPSLEDQARQTLGPARFAYLTSPSTYHPDDVESDIYFFDKDELEFEAKMASVESVQYRPRFSIKKGELDPATHRPWVTQDRGKGAARHVVVCHVPVVEDSLKWLEEGGEGCFTIGCGNSLTERELRRTGRAQFAALFDYATKLLPRSCTNERVLYTLHTPEERRLLSDRAERLISSPVHQSGTIALAGWSVQQEYSRILSNSNKYTTTPINLSQLVQITATPRDKSAPSRSWVERVQVDATHVTLANGGQGEFAPYLDPAEGALLVPISHPSRMKTVGASPMVRFKEDLRHQLLDLFTHSRHPKLLNRPPNYFYSHKFERPFRDHFGPDDLAKAIMSVSRGVIESQVVLSERELERRLGRQAKRIVHWRTRRQEEHNLLRSRGPSYYPELPAQVASQTVVIDRVLLGRLSVRGWAEMKAAVIKGADGRSAREQAKLKAADQQRKRRWSEKESELEHKQLELVLPAVEETGVPRADTQLRRLARLRAEKLGVAPPPGSERRKAPPPHAQSIEAQIEAAQKSKVKSATKKQRLAGGLEFDDDKFEAWWPNASPMERTHPGRYFPYK